VNADGRDEILCGGTSVSARHLAIAVWIDGALRQVTFANGDPFMLVDGFEMGPERAKASAFGCRVRDGDGSGDISSVTVEERPDGLTWVRVDYAIDAATVTEVGSKSGTAPGPADVETMQDLVRSLVSAGPVTWG
jgi:hypothetical protein